jgi:CheY-like chemotaxis protein
MASILLVEDSELLAESIKLALRRAGYKVARAADGQQALKLYDADSVDLVITDLVMPEMEGLQLIQELRKLNPAVKIIAISGSIMASARTFLPVAKHLGAARTLGKPFTEQQLLEAVSAVLGGEAVN